MDGPLHHHVSGYLTVTSLAARVRPSALSFGEMMVNTCSSSLDALREAVLGRELSASWLYPGCYLRMSL